MAEQPTVEKKYNSLWDMLKLKKETYQRIIEVSVHLFIPILVIIFFLAIYNVLHALLAPKKQDQQNSQTIETKAGGKTEVKNMFIQNPQRSGIRTGVHLGTLRIAQDNGYYAGVEVSKEW
jgi:hypothetical protein